jgi:hypothetical protein
MSDGGAETKIPKDLRSHDAVARESVAGRPDIDVMH